MGNVVLLFCCDLCIHREAQTLPCHALSHWKIARTMAEVGIRWLKVDRDRVV
jgi:hypothetical protein